jgi:hypothetical protein
VTESKHARKKRELEEGLKNEGELRRSGTRKKKAVAIVAERG